MARIPGNLEVAAIRRPGLHSVGRGLYLKITESNSRSWVYRFMLNGHSHKMGLGSCTTVALQKPARRLTMRNACGPEGSTRSPRKLTRLRPR